MSDRHFDKLSLQNIRCADDDPRPMVDICINGRRLVDIVREVELPFAQNEGAPEIAGAYVGLPPESVYLPSRALLDAPDEWYSEDGKASVLSCECGESGCWPLLARITLEPTRVIWSEFQQPHRDDWQYDRLGPFIFDRQEYEAELRGRPSVVGRP